MGSGWDSHCRGSSCSVTHFSSCNTSPSI
ncbi:hypothetical protein SEA_PSONYX_58 [Corynebacterium phage PSonyx]|nr:hypothetical protein SEA_PSONYX_58 [Corynebacterium phage PSonyx]